MIRSREPESSNSLKDCNAIYLAMFPIIFILNSVQCVPFEIPGNIKLGPISVIKIQLIKRQ